MFNERQCFGMLVYIGLVLPYGSAMVAEDWSRFLGPNGTAMSPEAKIPSHWDLQTNMKWHVPLPGFGSSSPIVVGNRVLVTCYSGYGLDPESPGNLADLIRHLICLDKQSGRQLWEVQIKSEYDEDPYEGFIREHGYASSTPVSDGERIFVMFGKTGLFAFDVEGNQLWQRKLGTQSDPAKWGDGCSPILFQDLVIINAGNVGRALVALHRDTGDEVWRIDDEGFANSWSTPILVNALQRTELVFSVPGRVLGIDPATGTILWKARSPVTEAACPSLAQHDGVVFVMGGREGQAAAIRCGGNGDVSETHTLWTQRLRAGIGTPLASQGLLFWHTGGIAYCVECATGKEVFRERLPQLAASEERRGPAGDYASAVQAGDRIVLVSRKGLATIIACAREFKIIGQGTFGDDPGPFNATPAIDRDQMFIRSNRNLYCIGQQD